MKKRTKTSGDEADEATLYPTALARGLDILAAFTPADRTLGNQELIERTGLPKATISRLTFALVGLGYLTYDQVLGRYSIGAATIALGYSGLSANPVIAIAKPLMQELANQTNLTVAMGERQGMEMLYLASCRSLSPVTLRLSIGSRLPMWTSAMGLAYLAACPETSRSLIVDELIAADPENAVRINSLVAVAGEQLARDGFVASLGEWYPYINAVGVPFEPTDGSPMLSITCGGITDIATRAVCMDRLGPALRDLASELQLRLIGQAPAGR
ncbi:MULTISPECIES: IclR family transcriptional regulator [unclassified Mesorhizobium]|uniref:IclR family transcriptional regulator n=1 Tax=unclassified Mesorhizobium TaxID=325217 RepID=UPI0015E2F730|nr:MULTISPECIES: IclR family transcriptional regulator [unclassified Mesorhizobium]